MNDLYVIWRKVIINTSVIPFGDLTPTKSVFPAEDGTINQYNYNSHKLSLGILRLDCWQISKIRGANIKYISKTQRIWNNHWLVSTLKISFLAIIWIDWLIYLFSISYCYLTPSPEQQPHKTRPLLCKVPQTIMYLQRDSEHFQNILLSIMKTKLTGKVPKMIKNILFNIFTIDFGNLLNNFPTMISQHDPKFFQSFQRFLNICKVLSSAYVLIKIKKL